jgi:hypothetical protein
MYAYHIISVRKLKRGTGDYAVFRSRTLLTLIPCKIKYITYYYLIVAASSFNTPLERRAPNGRPTTVLARSCSN